MYQDKTDHAISTTKPNNPHSTFLNNYQRAEICSAMRLNWHSKGFRKRDLPKLVMPLISKVEFVLKFNIQAY